MKISAINQNYQNVKLNKTNHKIKNSLQTKEQNYSDICFKGIKGGVKGGLIGAAAATALALVTGGAGFGLLPLWTAVGAISGSEYENENKDSEDK